MTSDTKGSQTSVAIIGAGLGGITMAINLQRQLGLHDFLIFEKAEDVGGTWRDNTYPGCSSDIGVHFYSLSTDLKDNWTYSHAPRTELGEYWRELAHKYNLYPHIRFQSLVGGAKWDDQDQMWHVRIISTVDGSEQVFKAKAIVSAVGILAIPRNPDIKGIDSYKGEIIHPARWRADVDLVGKRVGVIGNGASAAQVIPNVSKLDGIQVVQFCRTRAWHFPLPYFRYPAWLKWTFKYLPFATLSHRWTQFWLHEILWLLLSVWPFKAVFRQYLIWYTKRQAPAKYHPDLIPDYPPGCRRTVFDPGYLSSLHQDNIRVTFDGIERFTENGIVTQTGEVVPLDVVVTATGYSTNVSPVPIVGRSGQSVQEYYDSPEVGGPQAYLGTTLPGFPNYFVLSGPGTVTGHTSVIFSTEVQVDYIIQLLKPLLDSSLTSLSPTREATDRYDTYIQNWLGKTHFAACASWYRVDGKGKISSPFPGPGVLFWWWLRRVKWEDYDIQGHRASEWKQRTQLRRLISLAKIIVPAVSLVTFMMFARA